MIKKTNSNSKICYIKKNRNSNFDSLINNYDIKKLINYNPITTKRSIINLINEKYIWNINLDPLFLIAQILSIF